MKITKKIKKDFEATRDLWKWLADTGAKNKEEWPGLKNTKHLKNACAFCEYFQKKKLITDQQSRIDDGDVCEKCPLFSEDKIDDVPCLYPIYKRWNDAETQRTLKKYAKIMYDEIGKWCKENL